MAVQIAVFSSIVTLVVLVTLSFVAMVASILFTEGHGILWPFLAGAAVITFFELASQIAAHIDHSAPMRPLYFVSSLLMGVYFYSFLASVTVAPFIILAYVVDIGLFWSMLAILYSLGIALPVLWGLVEARVLVVRRYRVQLKGLRSRARLALISDVHLGLLVGKARLGRILSILESERPDLVLVAGDLYDTNPRFNTRFRQMLERLAGLAPVYAVFGNHEYFNGPADIEKEMTGMGFEVLRERTVKDAGTGIHVIGLDDPSFYASGEERRKKLISLLRAVPAGMPVVLLDHQPLLFEKASKVRPLLQLSGHTHAGQMWPASLITERIYKDGHRGLNRTNGSTLFVSVGAGTWGPPMRVLAPPEIILIDLH